MWTLITFLRVILFVPAFIVDLIVVATYSVVTEKALHAQKGLLRDGLHIAATALDNTSRMLNKFMGNE